MKRAMIITAIVLVAVVMGMSAVVPVVGASPLRIAVHTYCGGSAGGGTTCVALDFDDDRICDHVIGFLPTNTAFKMTGGLRCVPPS